MIKSTLWLMSILIACALIAFFATHQSSHALADEALMLYQKGENGKTPEERQVAFNAALSRYLQLEKTTSSSELYYDIGNTYFQLNQIPHAILYYYRALALKNDPKTLQNLTISQKKLDLPLQKELPTPIPTPFLLQLFTLFATLFFLLFSLYLWNGKKGLKHISFISCSLALLILGILLYKFYFTPSDGILIKASGLYLDAGEQYAEVLDHPLSAGTKVEVISLSKDRKWLKIRTASGKIGYISENAIRLI